MANHLAIAITHRFVSGVDVQASLSRAVDSGSILALFGPSGAGKTTILRAIAGLLRPHAGRIAFGDAIWFDSRSGRDVPPQARRVGYVSQDTALFPHLSVRANVGYGLAGLEPDERRQKAADMLALVGLTDLATRHPRQLSGGQAQRVALARALAPSPSLLLLDEPFGALDVATRRALRTDVRALIRKNRAAAVLVTHDRVEAMTMADDLAVITEGRIRQVGSVAEVFKRPADPVVARSLGIETILPAIVEGSANGLVSLRIGSSVVSAVAETTTAPGDNVFACIRADDVVVQPLQPSRDSARNHLAGRIVAIESEGPVDRITIDCGFELVAVITRQSREELALAPGSSVAAAIKATAVHVVPRA